MGTKRQVFYADKCQNSTSAMGNPSSNSVECT